MYGLLDLILQKCYFTGKHNFAVLFALSTCDLGTKTTLSRNKWHYRWVQFSLCEFPPEWVKAE